VIELDDEVVAIDGTVAGRVTVDGLVEVGPALDVGGAAPRFKAAASATVAAGERFELALPPGVPPTLNDGYEASIVWEVRAGEAWRRVGVIDPDAVAGRRNGRADALLTFLAALAGDRLWS
jgi:hypothetical protein